MQKISLTDAERMLKARGYEVTPPTPEETRARLRVMERQHKQAMARLKEDLTWQRIQFYSDLADVRDSLKRQQWVREAAGRRSWG